MHLKGAFLSLQTEVQRGCHSIFSHQLWRKKATDDLFLPVFPFLLGKKRGIFQHLLGGWGIRDTAQVSRLLLAGIVGIQL